MEPTPFVMIQLTKRDCQFILEALRDLEEKWCEINRTSEDEDTQAEFGMDAIVLNITREYIEREATKALGPGVTVFSRTPLP